MQQGSAVGGGVCSNFFFAIHTSSTCICGAVLSALQLGSALRQALCHQSPWSTPDGSAPWQSTKGWWALVLLVTRLPQHPSSCTAAGKGCARRATCDHMDAVCVSMPGTPPSTAATCLSRLAGAPCLVIIDRSHYSRRDREAFARSGELKQQLQGWHGQLSDMAVCISINGHQITNPQLLDFLFELLPRNQGMPTPRPSAAPHWLGPCKDSCNPL